MNFVPRLAHLAHRSWQLVRNRLHLGPPAQVVPIVVRPGSAPSTNASTAVVPPALESTLFSPPLPRLLDTNAGPRPARIAMRRAATMQALQTTGFLPPPRLLWPFVDLRDDVDAGIVEFFDALGYPLARLSTKNANRVLAAILRVESSTASLQPPRLGRAAERRRTFGRQLRSLAAAQAAPGQDAAPHMTVEPRFLRMIRQKSGRAAAADRIAIGILSERLALLAAESDVVRQRLLDCWRPEWRQTALGDRLDAALGAMERVELRFEDEDLSLTSAILETEIAVVSRAVRDLECLAIDAVDEGGAYSPPGQADPDPSIWADLLDVGVSAADFQGRWAELRWHHHPDAPQLSEDERSRRIRIVARVDQVLTRITASGRMRSLE